MTSTGSANHIGLLNEKPLHAALKAWYAEPGDRFEERIDGYVIDIVRGERLIEIQTAHFTKIKRKLSDLVARHTVRLVHPIAREKWLVKLPQDGKCDERRRKSPKRGRIQDVFLELVRCPHLMREPNFSLEVLLIQEEEVRRRDGKRAWRRRGWVTEERRLLDVVDRRIFESPRDVRALVPSELTGPFTTLGLAEAMDVPRWLAQKAAYCLRAMGETEPVGKRGNAVVYAWADADDGGGCEDAME